MNIIKQLVLSLNLVLCTGQFEASVVSNPSRLNLTKSTQSFLLGEMRSPLEMKSIMQICMDYIQGNILWQVGEESNKTWSKENLCRCYKFICLR